VLLGDPYRATALELLDAMEKDGWRVTLAKYTLNERAVGVFQLLADDGVDFAGQRDRVAG